MVDILRDGGLGVIPTDTCYMFVTPVDSRKGVERIYTIKEVESYKRKPLTLLCKDISQISTYTTATNFKSTFKDYSIPMPRDAMELSARFRTWAVVMYLLKMKFPGKSVLRTVEIELVDRYVEWLYGPENWGEVVYDANDKPISSPTMGHVMQYDYRIREDMAKYMNEGHDFEAAMMKARTDEHLRTRYFTRPVSVSINSSESRACSAPNVHGHSKGSAPNRAPPVADGAVTKSQLNRIKQQAKAEAMKELKRSYGLMS